MTKNNLMKKKQKLIPIHFIVKRFIKQASLGKIRSSFEGQYHCLYPGAYYEECEIGKRYRSCLPTQCSYRYPVLELPSHKEGAKEFVSLVRKHCSSKFISELPKEKRLLVIKGIVGEIKKLL